MYLLCIFSNKMAGNSKLKVPELLIGSTYFRIVFSSEILVTCLFRNGHWIYMYHITKNNFGRQMNDVIFPPNLQKMENKRHTIFCNEDQFSHAVKFEVNWIKNFKKVILEWHYFIPCLTGMNEWNWRAKSHHVNYLFLSNHVFQPLTLFRPGFFWSFPTGSPSVSPRLLKLRQCNLGDIW